MKKQQISKKDIYKYDIHISNELQPLEDYNLGYIGYEVNVSLQGDAMSTTSDTLRNAFLEHTPISLKTIGLRDGYYVIRYATTALRDALIFEADLRLVI